MIIFNKEILESIDFFDDFQNEICEYLESLIDIEFEKGDETDFDFIDECADAINSIRMGDIGSVLPVISRKDFINRIKGSPLNNVKALIAICAVVAVLFGVNAVIKENSDISIIKELSGMFYSLIYNETSVEFTSSSFESTSVTQSTTDRAPTLINISVNTTTDFKTEYFVGESFSEKGIRVYAEYDNGERIIISDKDFTVKVPDDFGLSAKYETIIVSAMGFEKALKIRVLENLQTKKLSSVYAVFPDDFDFKSDDLNNIDLSCMQVYAVYSDTSEEELSCDEYSVTQIVEKNLFEEYATVTVAYDECSCSFMVFKE